MPRNMNRFGATTAAILSMVWPVIVWCGSAGAEPSPGVPCFDLMRQLMAEPPSIPESLDTAANALSGVVQQEASAIPSVPVAEVLHGMSALAAPGPVVPVVPVGAPAPVVPVVTLPAVPLGDAMPGLPLLPATLPVPQDLICEGTGWSAAHTPAQEVAPVIIRHDDYRDEW